MSALLSSPARADRQTHSDAEAKAAEADAARNATEAAQTRAT